jgi:hypothetical protein
MVDDGVGEDLDTGFFPKFAAYGVFKGFAWFNETGKGREEFEGEFALLKRTRKENRD